MLVEAGSRPTHVFAGRMGTPQRAQVRPADAQLVALEVGALIDRRLRCILDLTSHLLSRDRR
jgi:hypothetical protein